MVPVVAEANATSTAPHLEFQVVGSGVVTYSIGIGFAGFVF